MMGRERYVSRAKKKKVWRRREQGMGEREEGVCGRDERERGSPAKKKLEGDRYRDSAKPRPGQLGKAQKGRLQGQQGSGESDQREAVKKKENE